MTIAESLYALSGYPIPHHLVANVVEEEGFVPDMECEQDVRKSASYKRCKAVVYQFLSTAPNVSQGGISFSFTDADKAFFRRKAQELFDEVGDGDDTSSKVQFGYQGDNF